MPHDWVGSARRVVSGDRRDGVDCLECGRVTDNSVAPASALDIREKRIQRLEGIFDKLVDECFDLAVFKGEPDRRRFKLRLRSLAVHMLEHGYNIRLNSATKLPSIGDITIACEICGNDFRKTTNHQKVCGPVCARELRLRYNKEYFGKG
jgi:hypothetical protein